LALAAWTMCVAKEEEDIEANLAEDGHTKILTFDI
jgi:hypothetical protein